MTKSDIGQYGMVPQSLLEALDKGEGDSTALRVFCTLAAIYADREGVAWPHRKTLAEQCHLSVGAIDRGLDRLKEIGALTVEARHNQLGDQVANRYTIHFGLDIGDQGYDRPRSGVSSAETRGLPAGDQPVTRSREPDPENQLSFLFEKGAPKDSSVDTQHKTVSLPKIHRLTEQDISELRTEFSDYQEFDRSLERCLNNSNYRFQRNKLLYVRQWLERDINTFRAARHKPGRFVNSQNDQHIGDYERLLQERDAR